MLCGRACKYRGSAPSSHFRVSFFAGVDYGRVQTHSWQCRSRLRHTVLQVKNQKEIVSKRSGGAQPWPDLHPCERSVPTFSSNRAKVDDAENKRKESAFPPDFVHESNIDILAGVAPLEFCTEKL